MQAHYVASDNRYAEALSGYFRKQGWELTPLSEKALRRRPQAILLFVPMKCGSIRVSPEALWKQYLCRSNRSEVLICAGFEKLKKYHPNYLDLLALPQDWTDFVARAWTVCENWIPPDTGGCDMTEKMYRFFEGHGGESFAKELELIREHLLALDTVIQKDSHEHLFSNQLPDYEYVSYHWQILLGRWNYYYPLFQYLPFARAMHAIEEQIKIITPFFVHKEYKPANFIPLHCLNRINRIHQLLTCIKDLYATNKL